MIIFISMIKVVGVLNCCKVIVIIVLLFGIIFWVCRVVWNIEVKGVNELLISLVLLINIKNLINVLMVFWIIFENFFFCRISLSSVIREMRMEG